MKSSTRVIFKWMIVLSCIYALVFGGIEIAKINSGRPVIQKIIKQDSPIAGTLEGDVADRFCNYSQDRNGNIYADFSVTVERNGERVNFPVSQKVYKQLVPGTHVKISYQKDGSVYKITYPNMDVGGSNNGN